MRIIQKQRTRIGKALYEISKVRHKFIPITDIDKVLRDNGVKLVQEDGTDWSGIICGRIGRCLIGIAHLDGGTASSSLVLEWHKDDHQTTFEINCYIS